MPVLDHLEQLRVRVRARAGVRAWVRAWVRARARTRARARVWFGSGLGHLEQLLCNAHQAPRLPPPQVARLLERAQVVHLARAWVRVRVRVRVRLRGRGGGRVRLGVRASGRVLHLRLGVVGVAPSLRRRHRRARRLLAHLARRGSGRSRRLQIGSRGRSRRARRRGDDLGDAEADAEVSRARRGAAAIGELDERRAHLWR